MSALTSFAVNNANTCDQIMSEHSYEPATQRSVRMYSKHQSALALVVVDMTPCSLF